MNPLRTFIKESIRSLGAGEGYRAPWLKKSRKSVKNDRFDWNTFKSIKSSNERFFLKGRSDQIAYAWMHLKSIGSGSGRSAFILSSKKVLKIAMNRAGELQNRVEFETITQANSSMLPKVFEHADDFSWITQELVNPVYENDQNRLCRDISLRLITNSKIISMVKWYKFISDCAASMLQLNDQNVKWSFNEMCGLYFDGRDIDAFERFVLGIRSFVNQFNLDEDELAPPHFGKTVNGNIVLLDAGINDAVSDEYRLNSDDDAELYMGPESFE